MLQLNTHREDLAVQYLSFVPGMSQLKLMEEPIFFTLEPLLHIALSYVIPSAIHTLIHSGNTRLDCLNKNSFSWFIGGGCSVLVSQLTTSSLLWCVLENDQVYHWVLSMLEVPWPGCPLHLPLRKAHTKGLIRRSWGEIINWIVLNRSSVNLSAAFIGFWIRLWHNRCMFAYKICNEIRGQTLAF